MSNLKTNSLAGVVLGVVVVVIVAFVVVAVVVDAVVVVVSCVFIRRCRRHLAVVVWKAIARDR